MRIQLAALGCLLAWTGGQSSAFAQQSADKPPIVLAQAKNPAPVANPAARRTTHAAVIDRMNQNTVTVVSGNPNGTLLYLAYDLSAVLDDEDNLRILPMVGKGAFQNVKDVLYLRGVDIAFTQSNILAHVKRTGEFGTGVDNRVAYIARLYTAEMHILAGKGIERLEDLNGKKVNYSDVGSGSQFAVRQIFNLLGVKPEEVNMGQADAYLKVKSGEIAATIITAGKPVSAFAKFKLEPGMKLLPVPYTEALETDFLPAKLTGKDYPNLLKPDEQLDTVAFDIVLIAYNWPRDTDRYRRIAKFVDALFTKFNELQRPPRYEKWKETNLAATWKGWKRFPAAQEWLDRQARVAAANPSADVATKVDTSLARTQAARAAPNDPAEQERLFQQFLEWSRTQAKR
jgi:TRAP transporter TAXI family solute receptor